MVVDGLYRAYWKLLDTKTGNEEDHGNGLVFLTAMGFIGGDQSFYIVGTKEDKNSGFTADVEVSRYEDTLPALLDDDVVVTIDFNSTQRGNYLGSCEATPDLTLEVELKFIVQNRA